MTRGPLDSYGRLCTEFYDLDKPVAPPDALEFYWRRYEETGGPALELMCGSGRFLVPFAQRGADIDGVDASLDMLAACQRRIDGSGLGSKLYRQRLEELDLPRAYRFAFVPAESFALVPAAVQQAALERIARQVEPGGRLVIEMQSANDGGASRPERRVRRPDGSEIVLTVDGAGNYRYDDVREGVAVATEVERYDWSPRGREEFASMLAHAGFETVRVLKAYADEAPLPGDTLRRLRLPAGLIEEK